MCVWWGENSDENVRTALSKGVPAGSSSISIEPAWLVLIKYKSKQEREDLNIFNLTLSIYEKFCVKLFHNFLNYCPTRLSSLKNFELN